MNAGNADDHREMTAAGTDYGSFALAVQSAYHEAKLYSPQAVPEVEERLRGKLDSRGVTLADDVLRALAFAIVNGRGL